MEIYQKVAAMDLPDTWNNYKLLLTLNNSNNENSIKDFLKRMCTRFESFASSRKLTQLFALAIEFKNYEIVSLLLQHGVRGNSRNELFTYTPMQRVVIWGYWKLILEFVQFGITYDEVDNDGNTLLHLAILNKNEQYDSVEHVRSRKSAKYQTEEDIVNTLKILLDLGLHINAVNKKGESPLALAVTYRMKTVTELLAERNALPVIFNNSVSHFLIMDKIEFSRKKKKNEDYEDPRPWEKQQKQDFMDWWFTKKYDINYRGHFEAPVQLCAKYNMENMLDDLLKYTNGINAVDTYGRSILHILFAYMEKDQTCNNENVIDFFKLMIDKGISVDYADKCGNTPFQIAGKLKRVDMLQMMIEPFTNVNACNNLGETALHIIMKDYKDKEQEDYFEVIRELVAKGADLNCQDRYGKTPLHIVCYKKTRISERIVQFFVEKGCDLNIKDANGVTPLYLAIQAKTTVIIGILINNGADVNCCERTTNSTPLHEAIKRNLQGVVESLLSAGSCDINIRDANGVTPLYLAIQGENTDIIELLMAKGADVNCCDKTTNSTPLHEATKNNLENVVESLLIAGAKTDIRDKLGQTPLHIAASECVLSSDIMSFLLMFNADIEIFDINRKTPLCIAFDASDYKRVKLLLRNGAKITIERTRLIASKAECKDKTFLSPKKLIIKHLVAQYLAGLPIKNCYITLVQRARRDLPIFYGDCLEELKLVKETMIEGVRLYDLLHMNFKRRYYYMKKGIVKNKLTDYELLKEQFPIYRHVISASYWTSVWRKPLFDTAKVGWYKLTTVALPEMCLEFILAHLENSDLKFIVEAAM